MSIEAHPNLHAVGLMTDIIQALQHRLRGPARKVGPAVVFSDLSREIMLFVIGLSEKLDRTYGTEEKEDPQTPT